MKNETDHPLAIRKQLEVNLTEWLKKKVGQGQKSDLSEVTWVKPPHLRCQKKMASITDTSTFLFQVTLLQDVAKVLSGCEGDVLKVWKQKAAVIKRFIPWHDFKVADEFEPATPIVAHHHKKGYLALHLKEPLFGNSSKASSNQTDGGHESAKPTSSNVGGPWQQL